jgi:hypothetical protein
MAQPFDPISRQLTGEGVRLADNVGWEGSQYSDGTMMAVDIDTTRQAAAGVPRGAVQERRIAVGSRPGRMTCRRTGSGSSLPCPQNSLPRRV